MNEDIKNKLYSLQLTPYLLSFDFSFVEYYYHRSSTLNFLQLNIPPFLALTYLIFSTRCPQNNVRVLKAADTKLKNYV